MHQLPDPVQTIVWSVPDVSSWNNHIMPCTGSGVGANHIMKLFADFTLNNVDYLMCIRGW